MKKSLIALAVASVFIAPAALAGTTVYGLASVSLDKTNAGFTQSAPGSRLGFKGAEKLGNGMSVFWGIETNVAFDNPGATVLGDRGASAGIGGSMGSVILGSGGNPYKGAVRGLDLFDGTVGANLGVMNNNNGGGNSIAYASPNISGFSVVVGHGIDEDGKGLKEAGGGSIAAQYKAGPLYATVATQQGNNPNGSTAMKGLTAGGSVSMDAMAVNVVFENTKFGTVRNTNVYLGGKYSLSKTDAVKVAYTSIGDMNTAGDTSGKTQMVIGYDHNMSKDTMVYALYSTTTANKAGSKAAAVVSLGLHKAF